MNADVGMVDSWRKHFASGSLVAIGARPGCKLTYFLSRLAGEGALARQAPPQVLAESGWQVRCLRMEPGEDWGRVAFWTRPSDLGEREVLDRIQGFDGAGSVMIDLVEFERRCLSRRFDPRAYLALAQAWCRRTNGLMLVCSSLLRAVERRGPDFIPGWRDLPGPLRESADAAVLLHRPSTYHIEACSSAWHEMIFIDRGARRITRTGGEFASER